MERKIPEGYILLARKTLNSGIMNKPPLYLKIWVWLLLKATKEPYGDLKTGQLRTSVPDIQEAMGYTVGCRQDKPSKRVVQQVISWLREPKVSDFCESQSDGTAKKSAKVPMIVTERGVHKMLITICNYESYQNPNNYEGTDEGTDEGTAKKSVKVPPTFYDVQEEKALKIKGGEVGLYNTELVNKKTCPVPFPMKGGGTYCVPPELIDKLSGLYPDVDVLAEILRAKKWCEDHPSKRKVLIERFLTSWVSRKQKDIDLHKPKRQQHQQQLEHDFINSCPEKK